MPEKEQIEVPADAVLQELVNHGLVTQAAINMAIHNVAMQIQYQSLHWQHEDLKSATAASDKDKGDS